ncbi:TraR/DksA C4-type zinc finger protein [Castellaniella denitrificans]|jgi:RNA polymerase-binding transcription factor DksA|uniref:TraR/DksA C4-type zinc finger protein n=1 Tax=Castellaniella denitrificans TaxID=56119 RepID=UPI00361F34A9
MGHLPESVLEVLKDRLIRLRDDALNEALTAEIRGLSPLATRDGEVPDRAERAEAWREEEIDKVETAIDHQRARAADAALRRIEDGCYGACEDCGRAISRARLLALPAALRCAACQQAYERRQGHDRPVRLGRP